MEWRFALTSFAIKVVIFWVAQLVVCELDPKRLVCGFVEKGFLPCLITKVIVAASHAVGAAVLLTLVVPDMPADVIVNDVQEEMQNLSGLPSTGES